MDGHVGDRQGAHDQLVLLDRVHAAEPRAERVADGLVARAGAHDVGDPLGDLAVARPQDRVERPGRGEQAVHLHAGDDVLEGAEAVLRLEVGGEQLEAGRHDDRADLDVHDLVAGAQVDAVLDRAGVDALAALGADAAVEAQPGAVARLGLGHRQLDLAEVGRGGADDLARGRRQRQAVGLLAGQDRVLVDDRQAQVEARRASGPGSSGRS